jgi:hypothetical protein
MPCKGLPLERNLNNMRGISHSFFAGFTPKEARKTIRSRWMVHEPNPALKSDNRQ